MRRVVCGIAADGQSTVVSDGPPPTVWVFSGDGPPARHPSPHLDERPPVGGNLVSEIWAIRDDQRMPNGVPDDPAAAVDSFTLEVPSGRTRWITAEFPPMSHTAVHRTDTIDYGLILRGSVDLELEDTTVTLHAGDLVVIPGVNHGWHSGPEGCVIATILTGLAEPGRGEALRF